MKHQKPLIRRTFLQERFEILIKKQKNGQATFAELTELDEIVNRDPAIRYSILEEMEGGTPTNGPGQEEIVFVQQAKPQSLLEKIKSFITHLFTYASGYTGIPLMSLA